MLFTDLCILLSFSRIEIIYFNPEDAWVSVFKITQEFSSISRAEARSSGCYSSIFFTSCFSSGDTSVNATFSKSTWHFLFSSMICATFFALNGVLDVIS